jgi:two-component system chemotaxis sensor kinase CheA
MVDKERLLKRLLATFVEEVDDQVAAVRSTLEGLDHAPDREERVRSILRAMHSLKGAARSVSLPEVEGLCHAMEDRLATFDEGALDALNETLDRLERISGRLRGEGLHATLHDIVAPPVAPDAAPVRRPSPPPAPAEAAPTRAPSRAVPEPLPEARPAAPAPSARVAAVLLDEMVSESRDLRLDCRAIQVAEEELDRLAGLLHSAVEAARRGDLAAEAVVEARRLLESLRRDVTRHRRRLATTGEGIYEHLVRLRMLPFGVASEGLRAMVASVADATGREIDLVLEGQAVEVDRAVLDALRDALRHLVRNAIDHGIEAPEERRAAGKRERGVVTVAAAAQGERLEVTVGDDGRGIDREAVRERLRGEGVEGEIGDDAVDRAIFRSGFTTRRTVTEVSGRGVGLDAVAERVARLNGTVRVETGPGNGTRFILSVPISMSRVEALLVQARPEGPVYAIPTADVERVARARPPELAVTRLAEVVGEGLPDRPFAVILRQGEERCALEVGTVLGSQALILEALGKRLRRTRLVAAASLLDDGTIGLVLSADRLIRLAVEVGPEAPTPVRSKRVAVVDDSPTTRALIAAILEGAGYEVVEAEDGEEAWQTLQGGRFDLVVSDVEMPRLDGIELARRVAGAVPLVLLTSRDGEDDIRRGLEAGARAWLVKQDFKREVFLETVRRFL